MVPNEVPNKNLQWPDKSGSSLERKNTAYWRVMPRPLGAFDNVEMAWLAVESSGSAGSVGGSDRSSQRGFRVSHNSVKCLVSGSTTHVISQGCWCF